MDFLQTLKLKGHAAKINLHVTEGRRTQLSTVFQGFV